MATYKVTTREDPPSPARGRASLLISAAICLWLNLDPAIGVAMWVVLWITFYAIAQMLKD